MLASLSALLVSLAPLTAFEPPQDSQKTSARAESGLLLPAVSADLSAPVGRVVRSIASIGERVEAGQELVRLHDTAERLDVEAAELAFEAARARRQASEAYLGRTRESLEVARRDYDMKREKHKAGTIGDAELIQAELSLLDRESEVRSGEAEFQIQAMDIDLARAELERAKMNPEAMRIVAPFAGVVVRRFVERAETTGEGPVISIIDPNRLHVSLQLSMERAKDLQRAGGARVFSGKESQSYEAGFHRMDPMLDPTTQTVKVLLDLGEIEGVFLPYQMVRLEWAAR